MNRNKRLGGHMGRCHIDVGAIRFLRNYPDVSTVVDIGCGIGDMVKVMQALRMNAIGIDGDPSLDIYDQKSFFKHDFYEGVFADERIKTVIFDLGWCVEFLEHIHESMLQHVFPLFQQCRILVITAAPPGTPGHHHVNCRPETYWIDKLNRWGFSYSSSATAGIKKESTMYRDFMRNHGMVFWNRCLG